MLYRIPKTRKYTYRPRFYKEQKDRSETEPRIKFRKSFSRPKKRRSYIGFLLLLFLVFFILNYLSRFQAINPDNMSIDEMEVVK